MCMFLWPKAVGGNYGNMATFTPSCWPDIPGVWNRFGNRYELQNYFLYATDFATSRTRISSVINLTAFLHDPVISLLTAAQTSESMAKNPKRAGIQLLRSPTKISSHW